MYVVSNSTNDWSAVVTVSNRYLKSKYCKTDFFSWTIVRSYILCDRDPNTRSLKSSVHKIPFYSMARCPFLYQAFTDIVLLVSWLFISAAFLQKN